MSIHETNAPEVKITESTEVRKIRELKGKLETKEDAGNEKLTAQEADNRLEQRLSNGGMVEPKLNKNSEVSFGASGCAGFCQKVHDGTKVHGTYY